MKHFVFIIFILLTIWAYWPSLQHAPKHDQLGFLADMALRDNAWDRTLGAYSLNREALFMRSDQFLFRPLLNLWLTSQLFVFGYNFTLWQGMAILLHLLVGFSLYRLLNTIRSGISAAVVAGFFLLMLPNLPMVVWHNISAYMIFCVFILEGILRWLRFHRNREDLSSLWSCILFLLLGSFIFEAGVAFCLCFAVVSAFTDRSRQWFILFLLPIFIYFFINITDFLLRNSIMHPESGRIASRVFSVDTILNVVIAFKWFLTTGIFLKAAEIIPIERVAVSPFTLDLQWPFTALNVYVFRGLLVLGLFFSGVVYSRAHLSPEKRKLIVLLFSMILSLTLFICLGRVNSRGLLTGLVLNSYYIYFFWVIALPMAYAFLSLDNISARPDGLFIRTGAYFLCMGMILVNALSIQDVNTMIARLDKPRRNFLDATTSFVSQHRHEKDFSFFVPHTCPGNYAGKWLHKASDPLWRRYTLAEALYPGSYTVINPKYILCRSKGQGNEH